MIVATSNILRLFTRRTDCLGTGTDHFDLSQCENRAFQSLPSLGTRTLARCLGTRIAASVPSGLGTMVFLWLKCAVQVVVRFLQNFSEHALGGLEHILIRLPGSVTSLLAIGQCISAFVKVPESLRQFAESSLFRIRLDRSVRGTRRFQTLVPFMTLAVAFPSWSLPRRCLRTDRRSSKS